MWAKQKLIIIKILEMAKKIERVEVTYEHVNPHASRRHQEPKALVFKINGCVSYTELENGIQIVCSAVYIGTDILSKSTYHQNLSSSVILGDIEFKWINETTCQIWWHSGTYKHKISF